MILPNKPMHLQNYPTPKSWRMNADCVHRPEGKKINEDSDCKKTINLECSCRKCIQKEYVDEHGQTLLEEGVVVKTHEEAHIFLKNCVGLYVRSEMVEIEFCTDELDESVDFEFNLDDKFWGEDD